MQLFQFNNEGESTRIEKFDQDHVDSEYQLESWLHSHPEVLLDEPLQMIGRQSNFGSGPIDLLALDQFGNTVVFELKKGDSGSGSTSEDRIIGQLIRYAQAVASCDYERLNDEYRQYQNQLKSGAWETTETAASEEELSEAFERKLNVSREPQEFNRNQRLVIVAEQITQETADSARYLLDEGINLQCREIRRFTSPEGLFESSMLAASTVVDYSLKRVTPASGGYEYSKLLVEVRERVRSHFQHLIESGLIDYVTKTPKNNLALSARNIYDEINVGYSVTPNYPEGCVEFNITLMSFGTEDEAQKELETEMVISTIRDCTDIPQREGYEVEPESSKVVSRKIPFRGNTNRYDDDFVEEVVSEFITLIELLHPKLVSRVGDSV